MSMKHTVRSYDAELKYLEAKITEMGGYAERMIENSVASIVRNDLQLATTVIADDLFLDEAERNIDEKAITIICKRQPMAVDLREIVGAIRISSDLERIGDMAKNIAKRTVALSEIRQPKAFYCGLETITVLALNQLKEVLNAYKSRLLDHVDAVRERDGQIDALYTSLFRELLTYMMEDMRNITVCTHLLFCIKNIERIGDHVTNIAETLHYIITGYHMSFDRPRDDLTYKVGVDEQKID
ncbi:phosphate signaling complex protein PhoU [Bartonella quintana]|uniref:Phosphate-specific transport system accessory protein PhoU n=3 Tax=Bartonella quintana TaxID=803 RepID=A0A0H3LV84_BARQU|nr:phosphate signaling complex protein PhoU [Bartonella quintana]ETS13441.1 phosphate transport system regulatory protein PhoU [Bartonella quintana BQ2-D70]ETS13900.1 phosphate transport system regulatory protein PhoU [Bartonella quintana JK 73rel]ETS15587.1 phosphate transport system regulatory protein PhoU [Bartonella quintana JK 73]ETS17592.1 phosphate transport system regulatory protein PhoU [Bartonella quintana JK 7]ETS18422.1 phosphate transport system regulatory protein PhoU [Bartonella